MPRRIAWTEGQDTQIRRLRTEGASWDTIAQQLGLARWTIIERARLLGVERAPANAATALDDATRPPLPAGHPDTWDALNRGTSLHGAPFLTPAAIR
ncbi:MAG: hypothetical protein B7Z80_02455 [Rhodospirillales bacterium 20-64-7]|nr:MAG: hypothetical protein B7Z80_02455 [Rhodospirillales bacterium 20-64-7]HQT76265.1 AsnC family protein [Rhodopila sp.]